MGLEEKISAGSGRKMSTDVALIEAAGRLTDLYHRVTGRPRDELEKGCYALAGLGGIASVLVDSSATFPAMMGVVYNALNLRCFDSEMDSRRYALKQDFIGAAPSRAKISRFAFTYAGAYGLALSAWYLFRATGTDGEQARAGVARALVFGSMMLTGVAGYLCASRVMRSST